MSKYLALAIAILSPGLLALGVFVFNLSWLLLDPLPEKNGFQPPLVEVLVQKDQLQQLEDNVNGVREAKRQVAREVIAKRRSLAEAIDAFRKMDQPWLSASSQQKVLEGAGKSEYEWCGLNVIAFARDLLADHPAEAAAVGDRLEKELQKLLAEGK